MTRELVYRMRTCAAALTSASGNCNTPFQRMHSDAADLLVEASNLLDTPEPLGELMTVLPPAAPASTPAATFTTPPCPGCGNVGARTVQRVGRELMLTCPNCGRQFPFIKPSARWQ